MNKEIREIYNEETFNDLKIDCEKCFGICCVALYFSKTEGFPNDKVAGNPCINLQGNFGCKVHESLKDKGLKGCMTYDCFGAGQKVAQLTFKGEDWRKSKEKASKMFDIFLKMRQLHEMLWYLYDAKTFICSDNIKEEIDFMIKETEKITNLDAELIINVDIENHRLKVNSTLKKVIEVVKDNVSHDKKINSKNKKNLKIDYDFVGADLKNTNLIGANFAGAFLIAADMRNTNLKGANLIGADLRDVDIRGANLGEAMFITQTQINSAKGDSKTKLPNSIDRPRHW